MANQLYGLGRNKFLTGDIAYDSDTIKVDLIDADDYTVSIDTHEFHDTGTVPSAAIVTTATLTTKSATLGVADAADTVFSAVTGDVSEALLIWKDTGTPATSPLIAYIDTATGLPVTPNGGDITVTWDDGANKIFKL